MSGKNFYTPGFLRQANVSLGNPLNPLVTGRLQPGGQIEGGPAARSLVLDQERERSHYFDGKLLKAQDLLRDQNYLDARLRQAGRAFGAGIVQGLEVSLADGWVSLSQGSGISPSGRVLELRQQSLRAALDDPALRQTLNQGRNGYLNSGLYLLLLSWHEAPSAEIAEVYPRQASVQPQVQPDAYDQGVRLELLALPYGLPNGDELSARSQLAEQFLGYGAEFPGLPADSLALGLLAVRDNRPLWLDSVLVRRDYRDERQPHAERLRLAAYHQSLLADLVRRRHASEGFELGRYFRRIPAMGALPKAMLDPAEQTCSGFPDHYQLSLVPVRADDLGFLQRQAAHLPPLDLGDPKVEKVQVLVPLANADYEALVTALAAEASAETGDGLPSLRGLGLSPLSGSRVSGIRSPIDSLLGSRLRLLRPTLLRPPARSAWELALAKIPGPLGLHYVREFELSAIQAPQVLPISAGFAAPAQPRPGPTPEPEPTPEPTPTPTPTPTPDAPLDFALLITARGSRHPKVLEAQAELEPLIKAHQELLRKLFEVLDNAYDRFFWTSLLASSKPEEFLLQFAERLLADQPPFQIIEELGPDFDLDDDTLKRWQELARVLGDLA